MTDTTLRRMVGLALILLFAYQIGTVVSGLATVAAGGAAALVVAVVTFLCVRRANAGPGNKAWFLVPTVLFTLLPVALKAWSLFSAADTSWLTWTVDLAPLVVGFLLPVLLLWLTYTELRKRTLSR